MAGSDQLVSKFLSMTRIVTFYVFLEKKNAAIDSAAGKHLIRNNHILLENKIIYDIIMNTKNGYINFFLLNLI